MESDLCAPTGAALTHARRLLSGARVDAADLRRGAQALRADTDWRARAADDYRAAVAELCRTCDRILLLIDLAESDVAALQGIAATGASCR